MSILDLNGVMVLPRGNLQNTQPLRVDMSPLYKAEERLSEIAIINAMKAAELMGFFNEAANRATRYAGSVQYELSLAQRSLDRAKARVIMEVLPAQMAKWKESGIKANEDLRTALFSLDPECENLFDRIDCLGAAIILLEGKIKSFVRAYNAARSVTDSRNGAAFNPNTSTPGLNGPSRGVQVYDHSEIENFTRQLGGTKGNKDGKE